MNRLLLAISLALALSSARAFCQENDMTKPNQKKSFERQVTKTLSSEYLLFLPKEYGADSGKKWPLIFFLHGAGERGTNVSKVAVHGPPKVVKSRPDFPFIVVSPQCPPNEHWSNEVLLALLDDVMQKYAVDSSRVYLTGLSMGGYGTWSLGLAYPERFAAIAPICGGGDPIPAIVLPSREKVAAIKSLPVWAFHGAKDNVVNVEESRRMVEALKKVGNEAKLTIYPEAQHDCWTETYNNQELYDWFLKQERKQKTQGRSRSKASKVYAQR